MGPALLAVGAKFHNDDRFCNELARDVRRTTNSAPAGHIKCLVTPTSSDSADYLASLTNRPLQALRFIHYSVATNSALSGKRIRISGWLKTSEVAVRAGASLVILNAEGRIFASDPMTDRPIGGTSDW